MNETPDLAAEINKITTMRELKRELKRRRIAAGFHSLPEMLRNTKPGYPLPRSTAYSVEESAHRSRWELVQAHLRACDAKMPEINLWHEAHGRALLNDSTQKGQSQDEPVTIPTAKQLAEMGPELGARILAEIDTETAADLLRRIDLRRAVQLVPQIHLSVILGLLAVVGQARVTLIFEQIDTGPGAELLAEMKTEDAITIMDEMGTRRVAELMGAMPRGPATRILRSVTADNAVRILTAMEGRHSAAFLLELDSGILEKLLDSASTQAIAGIYNWMDSEVASDLLTERMSDDRALKIMARMNASPLAKCLSLARAETTIRLVPRMPTERIARVLAALPQDVRIELLARSLSLQQAREVLLECIDGTLPDEEIAAVWLVEEISMMRVAEIVRGMDTPDAVLFLAIMNRRMQQQILAEMPMEEATEFTRELTPDGIARHISQIPSMRASLYFKNVQISSGVILSRMEPIAAIEMLLEENTFDGVAHELKKVAPARVALMLEAVPAETAARIMTDLPIEQAERVITAMDLGFADEMMSHIQRSVEFRFYDQLDISVEEWDKIRALRQEFAERLQCALRPNGLAEANQG